MYPFDRERLRRLYQFRCGYCGTSEVDVGAELEVDHYQPRSKGGSDNFSNLVYCCPACNRFKGSYWNPSSPLRVLHPHRDNPSEHFKEGEDSLLIPLTETGRFHLERLQLNRPQLVAQRLRKNREAEAERTYAVLLRRFTELESELAKALAELERLQDNS
jgi:hypothetical protein